MNPLNPTGARLKGEFKSMNPLNFTQPSHGKRSQSNTDSKPAIKVPCMNNC
ncbi:UNVERIFIED_CONTAM: hypothetical protein FKN15_047226 [Acipenser sinensis]